MAQAHRSLGRGGSPRERLPVSSLASRRGLRRSEVLPALRCRPDRGLPRHFVIFGGWRREHHHSADGLCHNLGNHFLSVDELSLGNCLVHQLVKNVFLKDERKISRKVVEMLLALILERNMSKWKLLCSYLSEIYWGHGIYGIESASIFYFGKHPSLLRLGESAMLVGIIPAPERLTPLKDPSRGRSSQARALRRMVEAGFLDIETALLIVKEPLCLYVGEEEHVNGLSQS